MRIIGRAAALVVVGGLFAWAVAYALSLPVVTFSRHSGDCARVEPGSCEDMPLRYRHGGWIW